MNKKTLGVAALAGLMTANVAATVIDDTSSAVYRVETAGFDSVEEVAVGVTFGDPFPGGSIEAAFGTARGSRSLAIVSIEPRPGATSWGFDFQLAITRQEPSLSERASRERPIYLTLKSSGPAMDISGVDFVGGHREDNPNCPTGFVCNRIFVQDATGTASVVETPRALLPRASVSSQQLGASLISSLGNAYNTLPTAEEEIELAVDSLNECLATPGCDIEAAELERQARLLEGVSLAEEVANSGLELTTDTRVVGPNGTVSWLSVAKDFVLDAIKWFSVSNEEFDSDDALSDAELEVSFESAEVEAEVGEFTVNPGFDTFLVSYAIDLATSSGLSSVVGQSFRHDYSFGESELNAGYGLVESAEVRADGSERLVLSFLQIETNDAIPLSGGSGFPVVLIAFAVASIARRSWI